MENFDAVGAWRTRDGGTLGQLADRRVGRAARRHQGRRRRDAAAGAAAPARDVRRHGDREADDLRARPRPAALRHAGGARASCATPAQQRLPVLVDRAGHREQHAVPEAGQGFHGHRESQPVSGRCGQLMRSTSTRGAADHVHHQDVVAPPDVPARHGRHAGLPLLEAMVPALTATAKTAANPPRGSARSSCRSASGPGFWTPKTVGHELRVHADSEAARAVPRSRDGRLRAVRPARRPRDDGGGVAERRRSRSGRSPRTCTTASRSTRSSPSKIGQDTPFPSLELATEDFTGYIGGCDTQYSCAYMNTISWANETTPLPMEINPRVAFERLFGRPGTSAAAPRADADRQEHPRLGAATT